MRLRLHVLRAVAWRDFASYFSTPNGYVFITLFVFLGSLAAFLPDEFFASNLANLDTLNSRFHLLLLFFIPAVTMGLWAEERKQGTDELLLTLPATDSEILLGKYCAALGIYLTSLLFSITLIIVLSIHGNPDPGLMFSTYVGYALLGATLLAVGMFGSLLAPSMTVAFILGVLFCALVVYFPMLASMATAAVLWFFRHSFSLETWQDVMDASRFPGASLLDQFAETSSGILSLSTIVSFAVIIASWLFLNLIILRFRRQGSAGLHAPIRFLAVVSLSISLATLSERFTWRTDLTAERLMTLSEETRKILSELDSKNPVYVRAFVSPQVPKEYVPTRRSLVSLLQEYEAVSGGGLVLDLRETRPHSTEAQEAEKNFGIRPLDAISQEGGVDRRESIYLGVAFTCGPEEVVVPAFLPGLPLEYELTRSVRVVARAKRLKLGVLATDAKLFGGFDFNRMSQTPSWSIVEELKKQYDVSDVSPDNDYPADLDVLLAVLPSSLTQPQMDRFFTYVTQGKPVVIVDDPIPLVNPSLAPTEMKGAGRNPFQQQGPPPQPKGDIEKALESIGIRWNIREIVWDRYNPHPRFKEVPFEVVFVGAGNGATAPFAPSDPITSGMQEVVCLFGGHIQAAPKEGVTFQPLLRTGPRSGILMESEVITRNFMGGSGINPNRRYREGGREYVLAARVEGNYTEKIAGEPAPTPETPAPGTPEGEKKPEEPKPQEKSVERSVKAVFVADIDLISEQFFEIRRQGFRDMTFDNVSFILNAIDVIAGDSSFVEVRKRRARHRTLESIERRVQQYEQQKAAAVLKAEEEATEKLNKAREEFESAVNALRKREDIDKREKEERLLQLQQNVNRQVQVAQAGIEREKALQIDAAGLESERNIEAIHNLTRFLAILLPAIPPLILAIIVFLSRLSRERAL